MVAATAPMPKPYKQFGPSRRGMTTALVLEVGRTEVWHLIKWHERRPSTAIAYSEMARPKRFELLTPRFVV
jgi:hypothetical protein